MKTYDNVNMRWPSEEEQKAGKKAIEIAIYKCHIGLIKEKYFWDEVYYIMRTMREKNITLEPDFWKK
jgi:hypothetical protein